MDVGNGLVVTIHSMNVPRISKDTTFHTIVGDKGYILEAFLIGSIRSKGIRNVTRLVGCNKAIFTDVSFFFDGLVLIANG